jgi:hypothetical protein
MTMAEKKKKERDPNLDNPSVILYRDVTHRTPDHIKRQLIVDAAISDMDKWKSIIIEWVGKGFNRENVIGLIGVYQNGWQKQNTVNQDNPLGGRWA